MLKVECSERYTCTRKYFRLSICHTDIHHTRSAGFMSEGRAAHPLLSCSNMRKIHCFLAVLITCHISAKTPRWSLSEKTTNLEHAYGCGFVSKSTGCLVQLSYAEKLKKETSTGSVLVRFWATTSQQNSFKRALESILQVVGSVLEQCMSFFQKIPSVSV